MDNAPGRLFSTVTTNESRHHRLQRTVVILSGRPFPSLLVETHVLTFRITTAFDEWAKTYDGSADLQKAAGITSLYRGVSKDDPSRCCAVMQADAGVMERFIADNAELIASSGHVLESTVAQVFLDHA
jgi:hypothetical protein